MKEIDSQIDPLGETVKTGATSILIAFFLSGMSGLIYQTVWVRMLTRYLGSTTAATATVLCVFMGGLALGAWLGGRLADCMKSQLTGYVILEISIAATAIVFSFLIISVLGGVYVHIYEWFSNGTVLLACSRIVFCMLCLLLPTVLMGATLPTLVVFLTHTASDFQGGLGRLYSINTFGAVLGVFITGFVLLGELGESSSLYVAALMNLVAALLVYRMQKIIHSQKHAESPAELKPYSNEAIPSPYPQVIRLWSSIAIFISGFSALSYEILWTRFLTLPLQTSIYAFSLMLAIFLMGIAYGSRVSVRTEISRSRPVAMFGLFEILIGLFTIAGMIVFKTFGQSNGFLNDYFFGVLTAFLIVFPVAFIFGWQLPIAVRCCISDSNQPGNETGSAYAINTTGAILGSILASFVMIPLLGTANSFVILAAINTFVGVALLKSAPKDELKKIPVVAGMLVVVFVVLTLVVGDPYKSVMEARVHRMMGSDAKIFGFYEDVAGNTVPAASPTNRMNRHLFINGVGMTILTTETKLMAHLPMLLTPEPNNVLVICFGMGTTVRSAAKHPANGRTIQISAVDIVPKVFDCFQYFHDDADEILALPNVHIYGDDGRNFLLFRKELYDVITIDPAPPLHSAGTVNLYSKEFFELCKSKIKPNGVVSLWVPPAAVTESLMIMRTFVDTFPGATLWGGLGFTGFYLIGGHHSFDQTNSSLERLAEKLSDISDLKEWDPRYGDKEMLKRLYVLNSGNFKRLVENARPVSDDHPYTEFPLWRGILTGNPPIFNADILRNVIHKQIQQQ